jgi:hypothetical protein
MTARRMGERGTIKRFMTATWMEERDTIKRLYDCHKDGGAGHNQEVI